MSLAVSSVQKRIENKLRNELAPIYLEVVNESENHAVPAGAESHFRVVIAANDFDGKRLVERHRKVYQILAEELKNEVHALALHTYTADEWRERDTPNPESPPCRGGSRT